MVKKLLFEVKPIGDNVHIIYNGLVLLELSREGAADLEAQLGFALMELTTQEEIDAEVGCWEWQRKKEEGE